ncbi:nuclear transport factor 2 family protein [Streptomyces sp. NPDC002513]
MSNFPFLQPGLVNADPGFLADRAAISDVLSAYSFFFDSGDFEALAGLFTEDACFYMNPAPDGFPEKISSGKEIASALPMLWNYNRNVLHAHQRHVTTNTLITRLSGTQAEASSFLTATFAYEDGRHELRRTGTYVDLLYKEGAQWRIALRRLHFMEVPRLREATPLEDGL